MTAADGLRVLRDELAAAKVSGEGLDLSEAEYIEKTAPAIAGGCWDGAGAAADACDQLADTQVLHEQTLGGGQDAVEHVVEPGVLVRALERDDVAGTFDDADSAAVTSRVPADLAGV